MIKLTLQVQTLFTSIHKTDKYIDIDNTYLNK